MNASSATQHLASNATAAPGLQPTPMLNHWLQGLPAITMSVLHCEENITGATQADLGPHRFDV